MSFLLVTKKLPIILTPKDAKGNVARVDGAPTWALTDASVGSLEVAVDGMSAMFIPSGVIGTTKVQAHADADLGAGVRDLLGEYDVEVIAGEAVVIELSAGEPVDI